MAKHEDQEKSFLIALDLLQIASNSDRKQASNKEEGVTCHDAMMMMMMITS